jgi:hypothetical protein
VGCEKLGPDGSAVLSDDGKQIVAGMSPPGRENARAWTLSNDGSDQPSAGFPAGP